jgi:hypothetical protein
MITPPPLPQQPAPRKKRGCLRVFLIVVAVLFGLFIILAIIGALVGPSGSQSNAPVTAATSAPETNALATATVAAAPPQRPISWREIDSIYNLRSKNTDLQKDEAWKRYKGKRVTWSGEVTSVSDGWTGLTLQVKMNPDTFTSDLLIKLKKVEKSKAAQLHQGDQVRFTGILRDWGSLMPITLDDAEIVQ